MPVPSHCMPSVELAGPPMPRRQSCDRCHEQKVRCFTDGPEDIFTPGGTADDEVSTNGHFISAFPCMRCKKAGAMCIYSRKSSSSFIFNFSTPSLTPELQPSSVPVDQGSPVANPRSHHARERVHPPGDLPRAPHFRQLSRSPLRQHQQQAATPPAATWPVWAVWIRIMPSIFTTTISHTNKVNFCYQERC